MTLHRGWIENVYDGDTFTATVQYGDCTHKTHEREWVELRRNLFQEHRFLGLGYHPGSAIRERIRIRLLGVDAPEVRGEEKAAGKISAQWVRNELEGHPDVEIEMVKRDSFGRWLCSVRYGSKDLATQMLSAGMAQVYSRTRSVDDGGIMRVPW